MLYFMDTEFHEDGKTIDLISLGIVAQDGRELYACNLDAELHRCHAKDFWLKDNVLSKLPPYDDDAWMRKNEIRTRILDFVLAPLPLDPSGALGNSSMLKDRKTIDGKKPEFWGYYSDYDWVVFCQLFGRMIDLPPQFPMFCMDLKQLSVDVGSPKHPKQDKGEHNALSDARWNRDLYKFLRMHERS